ncbi:hypothetical protein ILUMI_10304 [Ignelater luminosus]|uniref:CLIP domain-containing serine protease n=1 Tax=Ignelater luminosus TaxID=2038154 RepID=A0A8K0CYD5_IGNLU|nr:hypothetical protein ILUMI_10304 [Ignelater luminosus]
MFVKLVYSVTCSVCLFVLVQAGNIGYKCVTPNGEVATCTSYFQCDVIRNAVAQRVEGIQEFYKKSLCGREGNLPLVCCGSVAKETQIEPPPSCTTPNGEPAGCISLSLCAIMSDAMQTLNNDDAKQFIKDSECGYNNETQEVLVCCGSEAYPLRTNLLPNRSVCGNQTGEIRIHGGTETKIWEFPWMALLRYKYNDSNEDAGYNCGGTVINNRYILTAAHCVHPHQPIYPYEIRLGEWKISSPEDCEEGKALNCADPVIDLQIEEKIVHPQYYARRGNNDIALLRLNRNIKFSNYIQPVCLPVREASDSSVGSTMTVVGWGIIENDTTSDVKLKLEVPIVSRAYCSNKLRDIGSIDSTRICAGGEAKKGICGGDSGGPLLRSSNENSNNSKLVKWFQEGIVSKGPGCGIRGYPAVYIRVAHYIDWIIENLKEF